MKERRKNFGFGWELNTECQRETWRFLPVDRFNFAPFLKFLKR